MDTEKAGQNPGAGPGYETSDANPRGLVLFGVGILPILVKTKGKTTTDHISPAGAWLRFR